MRGLTIRRALPAGQGPIGIIRPAPPAVQARRATATTRQVQSADRERIGATRQARWAVPAPPGSIAAGATSIGADTTGIGTHTGFAGTCLTMTTIPPARSAAPERIGRILPARRADPAPPPTATAAAE